MDSGQWQQLLTQDVPARWLNRRYLVIPVRRNRGVFHAKLNLLISDKSVSLHCGSANLTRAGCSHNLELLNGFRLSFDSETTDRSLLGVLQTAFGFFECAAKQGHQEAASIAQNWIKEARDEHQWLSEESQPSPTPMSLVHTYDGSLWDPLKNLFRENKPSKITIISPFFDAEAEMFHKVRAAWPKCRIEVIAQNGTSGLPVAALKEFRPAVALETLGAMPRRLHAKLLVIHTSTGVTALVGSANFTTAALEGRNVEACFLVPDAEGLLDGLFDGQFTKRRSRLEDFETGDEREPVPAEELESPLAIKDAVLLPEGKLRITYTHRLTEQPRSLAVSIRCAGEQRPRATPSLSKRLSGSGTVDVPKAVTADAHGSLLVSIIAETESGRIESRPVWVIQEQHLTHLPSEGHSTGKERVIEDSGHGLAEYLDELGRTGGVANVIQYLNRLNIRFYDGTGGGSGGGGRFRVKRRDPFHTDSRPDWMISDGVPPPQLKTAIFDFTDRHERQRLRRHAERGNINGLENFLDVFTTMVQLLYIWHRRGTVEKQQFIGRVSRYLEIATSGVDENSDDWCDGYLDTLSSNLEGDRPLLKQVCREANFGEVIQATLFTLQKVRFDPNEVPLFPPKVTRPTECLPTLSRSIQKAFANAGLPLPKEERVVEALSNYGIVPADEFKTWVAELSGTLAVSPPEGASTTPEVELMDHFKMRQLLKVAQFKCRGRGSTPSKCLQWVRDELNEMDIGWNDWLWMLARYGSDPHARANVDHLTDAICGTR